MNYNTINKIEDLLGGNNGGILVYVNDFYRVKNGTKTIHAFGGRRIVKQ